MHFIEARRAVPHTTSEAAKNYKAPRISAKSYPQEKLEAVKRLMERQREEWRSNMAQEEVERSQEDMEINDASEAAILQEFPHMENNVKVVDLGAKDPKRPHSMIMDEPDTVEIRKKRMYPRDLRNDACLQTMILEGYISDRFRDRRKNMCLCIGGHSLRWPDDCMSRKYKGQKGLGVWIDYEEDGSIHPEAWCKEGHPNLLFKLGCPMIQ